MKRIFAIFLTVCMILTLLSMTVIGAVAASGEVFRISGQKKDGSLVELKRTSDYTEGWNYAMEKAIDHDWMSSNGYVRVVADLLADWNAVDGEFSEDGGTGFKWDTIYVEEEAIITLNLNGHTINRGLTDWEYNGEVISVDDEANLIINGGKNAADAQTGKIKGGFSCNGGGGIHVEEDANLTLNNVNVVENAVEDDLGSAIHILDGSRLTMNGGSIASNKLTAGSVTLVSETDGTVYIEDADATFNKVTFSGNISQDFYYNGLAVYATGESKVTLNECIVENHGQNATNDGEGPYIPYNLFYSNDDDVRFTLNKCTVKNNKCRSGGFVASGKTVLNECTFTGNDIAGGIFRSDSMIYLHSYEINNSTFTDNPAPINLVSAGFIEEGSKLIFKNCTFNNNGTISDYSIVGDKQVEIKLVDCELGDSVIKNKNDITIVNEGKNRDIGSMFSEGSVTTIVSFLALFISIGAIGAIIVTNKKKVALAAASGSEDDD